MKQKYFIDSNKVATAFVMLILMAIYNQWQNPTAWVYLALHGGYGLLWFLKSRIFPDAAWEEKASLGYGLVIWAGLSLYWVAGWIVMARGVQAPAWYLGLCVSLYLLGVFAHFTSDMQKHILLKLRPGVLISDGMFARLRNPNYFGELLIYAGFGLLAMHWLPIAILLLWIIAIWFPRMRKKDRALAQLAGFETYREQTKLFIPFLF
jgi:protein-S-isoprenylcysteine O-methyltransferase Ste14